MSEIAACTLIQEKPDRKTERYLTMFKDYPDVVTVEHLQEMSPTPKRARGLSSTGTWCCPL